jgi:hypothetical protein
MNGFSMNMNKSQKIGLAAVSVFAVSHFLPAYDTLRGFSCFLECWQTMCHFDPSEFESWLYYSGFALSNIMLPILVVGLFVSHRGWQFRTTVSSIMLLHTASWSIFESLGGSSSIKIGYYLWLGAYGLLNLAYRSYPDGAPDPESHPDEVLPRTGVLTQTGLLPDRAMHNWVRGRAQYPYRAGFNRPTRRGG